uniref:Uncharacterized protein n=1 Tax=Siphoviridae sp. ctJ3t72 TaxID=2826240 RepID=A0A8S5QPU8_9CAUD|nr:MAG TPA: hypothetical protein [Siphoviridae sp. ctJ3t72]
MYELMAITVAMIISIFNLVLTYLVAKTVSEHTKIISLLAKTVAVLTEFYAELNTTTDREDK